MLLLVNDLVMYGDNVQRSTKWASKTGKWDNVLLPEVSLDSGHKHQWYPVLAHCSTFCCHLGPQSRAQWQPLSPRSLSLQTSFHLRAWHSVLPSEVSHMVSFSTFKAQLGDTPPGRSPGVTALLLPQQSLFYYHAFLFNFPPPWSSLSEMIVGVADVRVLPHRAFTAAFQGLEQHLSCLLSVSGCWMNNKCQQMLWPLKAREGGLEVFILVGREMHGPRSQESQGNVDFALFTLIGDFEGSSRITEKLHRSSECSLWAFSPSSISVGIHYVGAATH